MPSFPIVNAQNCGLGGGGGGTEAPALLQGLMLIALDANGTTPANPLTGAVPLYACSSDPTSLTGQTPGGFIFGVGSYAGQVYVVNDSGVPVLTVDNGVIVAPVSASLLLAGNGTVGAPSISFANSATSGFYRSAADTIGLAVAGALDFQWSANLFDVLSGSVLSVNDGATLLQAGATTGTGRLIQVQGPDTTHGVATYCYEATVSPSAVETSLFTVPAMSRIVSVQANVQSALTGGGTTVTFGVGITGDVDAYGTASNSGVQADLLTKNAKINAIGNVAAGAGASLGVWSAATVALKLIAAATGGTSAGNTALTVGSVKVRVTYQTLLPLADAP